ncbi:Glutamyl-tRNA synthetase [Candidatus Chazhemtobacterium aquaticus]|uniref:Glutamate--tRNA ligase n=2 Tax=Candidatus Chazhemtobacterium aquaticus TaxID=2715735 RepID=A0A857NBQ4_9BACT|nr:Glutamyl-tRNA synthetase [Candidatus Chazhemtobacterium aquaticus]
MAMATVRTRIAPSPTGIPHIGNTRTALFSYLLAKKNSGQFILRIEDTDQKRLVPESLEAIYEIHDFLKLIPDEDPRKGGPSGPYIQTQRLDLYQKYAQELLEKGVAYQKEGAIRIKMPKQGYTSWNDLVQGKISIPNQEVDDKVLLKSNGIPTYHLAVVVDDHLMNISHIIRGVEWISSTPVHLHLYQALGWQVPIIAHVPLLLGPDKTKLSKRHGAKSVLEYRDDGYLPEAINNFLFYLGNSYQDNSAILTLKQMAQIFDETKLQKQNAIFDIEKLQFFNKQWIKRLTPAELLPRLKPFLPSPWVVKDSLLLQIIPLTQERLTTLKDFPTLTNYFFSSPDYTSISFTSKQHLIDARAVLSQTEWNKSAIESSLQQLTDTHQYHRGQFFMDLRLAITGQKITPPLTESMLILGQQQILSRLDTVIKLI